MKKGIIFDIQRFSLHDGPGLRTIVFLKGCPLNCSWCSNPESHNLNPEIMYFSDLCIGCYQCINVCPTNCISRPTNTLERKIHLDYNKCIACGSCQIVCPAGALSLIGKPTSVEMIIETLEKDKTFYNISEGGITLSGGELFTQKAFAIELIKACKARGWHVTIETTGFYLDPEIAEVLSYVDLILYDLKVMNPALHKKYTGQDLGRITRHFPEYLKFGKKLIVRVPIIPGVNNTRSNTSQLLRFLSPYKGDVNEIHLLPYHEYGKSKYDSLGLNYEEHVHLRESILINSNVTIQIEDIKSFIKSEGYKCQIGG